MASISTTIMEEFLRSGTPQVRRNALTALAVVDDEASARLIARAAIEDEDAAVRRRAEEESLSLGENSLRPVNAVFLRALKSPEFQKQQRAYAMLGRLKSKGIAMPPPQMPWGSRMRLAGSMSSYLYPVRSLSFRLRSWQSGLLGTLLGLLPFIIFMIIYLRGDGASKVQIAAVVGVSSLAVLVVGAVSAIFATQFTTPISLQLRPFAATLVELMATFVCVLTGGLLLVLLIVFFWNTVSIFRGSFGLVLLFVPLIAIMAGTVRLGTVLAFASRLNFSKASSISNWLVQIIFGTATGSLFATSIYLLFKLNASPYDLDLYKGLWLASLAVVVGLANAFAKIDGEAYSNKE